MKITLITSDQPRHIYFTNLLNSICSDFFLIQEKKLKIDGRLNEKNKKLSENKKKYFDKVKDAENKVFGEKIKLNENITNKLSIKLGQLNKKPLKSLTKFLDSDIYVVFGSSYIKSDLIDFLIKKKALNIHMGVSPFYRGTDCNFWALNDNNPHLVGGTIHYISKGLDSGPILYHAISSIKEDPFLYTMSTVKSAFISLVEKIEKNKIFNHKPINQDKKREIRYSKKNDFDEKVICNFLEKKIDLNSKKFDNNMLINPYLLNSL
tara:strand:- start:2123 stop:2914 length:792 start_codon:yes stop_codon:yes gene_type:complete